MKKTNETVLLFLFCTGIIVGLLLPRWIFSNVKVETEILTLRNLEQYISLEIDHKSILGKIGVSRMTIMFILYFACYSAAGFGILAGTAVAVGLSMGFFAVMAVLQLQYWGIIFWCCALLPQWIFYSWAGLRIARFRERRKNRTEFCNGNAAPVYTRKVLIEFIKIFLLMGMGILTEVYLNSELLRYFLRIYSNRT